jgi:retron-type reverse transcriptase
VLIDECWRGRRWVVETDIASCFEEIPHDRLMQAIEERVCDRRLLRLLGAMLRAGVMEQGAVRRSDTGTPQGGVRTAPTQSQTSSLSGRFGGRRGGVGREAWYSSG